MESTLARTESSQALARLPEQVCQPPPSASKALPPAAAELAGRARASLFPFSQSCSSVLSCGLSTCYSRPGPALGLQRNPGAGGRESPVHGVYHAVGHLRPPRLPSPRLRPGSSGRKGQREGYVIARFVYTRFFDSVTPGLLTCPTHTWCVARSPFGPREPGDHLSTPSPELSGTSPEPSFSSAPVEGCYLHHLPNKK